MLKKKWKIFKFRLGIAIDILLKGRYVDMVMVYIICLRLGIITKDQVHPHDVEKVYAALEVLGETDLWE